MLKKSKTAHFLAMLGVSTLDDYEIGNAIGKGCTSSVIQVIHRSSHRSFALKIYDC